MALNIKTDAMTGDVYFTPYLSYVAILNQTGTDNPVAAVMNSGDSNYIGSVVWTRIDANGNFHGTLSAAFPLNKTLVFLGQIGVAAQAGTTDVNYVYLALGFDDVLIDTPIEIRVYP